MAQFRLSISIASRGKGRSATAMAAYRAGEALQDERTGERFDFTRKRGILHTEMVLPADAPEWAHDRATFWNRSEAADKRADSQVAREIQLSLPHELSNRERRELATGFAQEIAARYGVAVDTCVHAPHPQGDERNHHAHLLLCTRGFDEDKKTGFGNKVRAFDNIACQRQGQESEVERLRENWAQRLNEALRRAEVHTSEGALVQVDHRSYERQGIEQEPTVKEGPAATGLKRRGEPSERAQENEDIRSRNSQRDRLREQIGAVASELATLRESTAGGNARASADDASASAMTDEEKKQEELRLREAARIDDFRERFEKFKEQQRAADAKQTIGRDCDPRFEVERDPSEQRNEKEQRIDDEFEEDMNGRYGLVRQDLKESRDFEDWMKEQRERMRSEDAARNPQKAELHYVLTPGPGLGITHSRSITQPDPDFVQKESLRNAAGEEMRKEFTAFQEERNADRQETLTNRKVENLDLVKKGYEQEVTRQELEQSLTRPRQAANRTSDDLRRDLAPTQEQDNIKPKKGESMEEARARAARIEQRKQEQEEQKRLHPTKKDDWTR